MTGDKDDSRIVELEVRIAHQDHLIASLDEVVRTFAARVERLERQLKSMEQTFGTLESVGPANEPPPHY